MTEDLVAQDERSRRLTLPVFRPLQKPAGAGARSVPRFLRPAPAATPPTTARVPAPDGPRFSRFAAVVEARPAAAAPDRDAQTPPRSRGLHRALRRAGAVRSVTLASSAVAAAVLMVALIDWPAGDRAAPAGSRAAPAAATLLATPGDPTAAGGGRDGLKVGGLLLAYRPAAVPLAGGAGVLAAALPPAAASPPAPQPPALVSGSKLVSAASVDPGSVGGAAGGERNPLYELAFRLQRKGEIASALAAYQLAAEANPKHAATFYNWGHLLQQRGDLAGARARYRETLQLDPQHAFAHYNLASLLQHAGDREAAIEHYRAAIAAGPGFAWSYYNLGYLEQQLGHYQEALANYRRAIETDPEQTLAHQNIATILRYHHP